MGNEIYLGYCKPGREMIYAERQDKPPWLETPIVDGVRQKGQEVFLIQGFKIGNAWGLGVGTRGGALRASYHLESDHSHTHRDLSSVVSKRSSLSPFPGSLCKLAHVLWQAEQAVGCRRGHLPLLLIWGGAG